MRCIPHDDTSIKFINLCNTIKQHLYQTRIQVNFLPEIDKQAGSYEQLFDQLVDNCIFVIAMKGDFEKSLSYEYGYLRGIRKPIIVINTTYNPTPANTKLDRVNHDNYESTHKEILNKF